MLKLESYKLFKRKIVLVVMTGIFLIVLLQEISTIREYKYYKKDIELMDKHKGIYTDLNFTRFYKDAKKVLDKQEISYYKFRYFEEERQKTKEEVFNGVDFDIHFGYFNGWINLFYKLTIYLKCIPIFIVIAFASIFSYENECGMQEILLSTKNGRKECGKAKLRMGFIVTNIFLAVIVFVPLIHILFMVKGKGWDTSIQMFQWLMDSKLDLNNLWMFIHTIFFAFLSINFIVIMTFIILLKTRNSAIAMCISLGILYVFRNDIINTIFYENKIASYIVSITPINVLEGLHMAGLEPVKVAGITIQWLYIVEALYIILLAAGVAIFYRVLKNNQKYYSE